MQRKIYQVQGSPRVVCALCEDGHTTRNNKPSFHNPNTISNVSSQTCRNNPNIYIEIYKPMTDKSNFKQQKNSVRDNILSDLKL